MEVKFPKSGRNWDHLFHKVPQSKLNLAPSFLTLDSEKVLSAIWGRGSLFSFPIHPESYHLTACNPICSFRATWMTRALMQVKIHWTTGMQISPACTVPWNPKALWVLCHHGTKSIKSRRPGSWDIASLDGLPSQFTQMSAPSPPQSGPSPGASSGSTSFVESALILRTLPSAWYFYALLSLAVCLPYPWHNPFQGFKKQFSPLFLVLCFPSQ